MIEAIRQGLKDDGFEVAISRLCRWFAVPRRTVYYRPTKAAPRVSRNWAAPIKALIEEEPSFGYRTVAGLMDMSRNTVQRVFQLMIGDWIQFYNHRRPHQVRPTTAIGLSTVALSLMT